MNTLDMVLKRGTGPNRPEWPNQIRNAEELKPGVRLRIIHTHLGRDETVWKVVERPDDAEMPADSGWFWIKRDLKGWARRKAPDWEKKPVMRSLADSGVTPYGTNWNQLNYLEKV
jgi:hypothetical protein